MNSTLRFLLALAVLIGSQLSPVMRAEPVRALPAGNLPADSRLNPPKDLDGYFPFAPPASRTAWEARSQEVRQRLKVALGLWPELPKTPLNAVIHGKIDMDDYTIEKVYFESIPGFFVSGNLYRPKGKSGKLPAVLNPHGHWANGRFYDDANGIKREIIQGAERFEDSGRSPLQARCVQLARMGCVAFFYDMIGYADSQQISQSLAHGFAKQRPEMNTTENWGLFSPQAEAHLQSVMGLQTWSSIRALDFLSSLPDVDPSRIGVTGASGGGTQTFILCALDPRPVVSFPAVMVSTAMQGGCTCENASLLRVGTGNVEIAGLFAPKPQGLTAADDWTKEMATKGFPELKQLYAMLGAPDNVMLKAALHFGHNYNHVSRAAMYGWMNKHLKLGLPEPVVERDYKRLPAESLTVWDAAHPRPPSGPEFERSLLKWWHETAGGAIAQSRANAESYRDVVLPALEIMIGRTQEKAGQVSWKMASKVERAGYLEMSGLLRNETHSEEIPVVWLHPKDAKSHTVLWLSDAGKSGLWQSNGSLKADVKKLLDAGVTVVGVDLLFQGEFLQDGQQPVRTRRVKNPREFAGYTFGYNPALFAQRTHDVLTVLRYARTHENRPERLDIIALDGVGPIAIAARAVANGAVTRLAAGTSGFRFGKVLDLHDVGFLPGGAKYDDLPGMLAVASPAETWLVGEDDKTVKVAKEAYARLSKTESLRLHAGAAAEQDAAAVAWLLNRR